VGRRGQHRTPLGSRPELVSFRKDRIGVGIPIGEKRLFGDLYAGRAGYRQLARNDGPHINKLTSESTMLVTLNE